MRRSLTLNYASVLSIAFQKYTKLTQENRQFVAYPRARDGD